MSKDDLLKIQEKEQEEKLLNSQITTKAVTKISIPGTFTMYQQINNYYCAPASVKSVLQYINGSSDSQSTIANGLGTTSDGTSPTKIAPYLNQKQSFYYARFANPSQTDMCDNCMLQLLDLRNLVLCPLLILVEVTGIIQQEDIDLL